MNDEAFFDAIDAWLLGELSPEESAAFERAMQESATRALAVSEAEAALAAIWVDQVAHIPPSPHGKERLMASISPAPQQEGVLGFASTVAALLQTTLEHARALLTRLADDEEWFPGPAPGTRIFHIDDVPLASTAIVGFIEVAPGESFPQHAHVGEEVCLVVQGALRDEETIYERGQLSRQIAQSEHAIHAHGQTPLIYLTIVDRGIKFGEFFIGPGDPEI